MGVVGGDDPADVQYILMRIDAMLNRASAFEDFLALTAACDDRTGVKDRRVDLLNAVIAALDEEAKATQSAQADGELHGISRVAMNYVRLLLLVLNHANERVPCLGQTIADLLYVRATTKQPSIRRPPPVIPEDNQVSRS